MTCKVCTFTTNPIPVGQTLLHKSTHPLFNLACGAVQPKILSLLACHGMCLQPPNNALRTPSRSNNAIMPHQHAISTTHTLEQQLPLTHSSTLTPSFQPRIPISQPCCAPSTTLQYTQAPQQQQ